MIAYNSEIKTKEELCSWFLAETDWLADCIDGELMQGKRPDNALVKKVRSRLAAYCAYTGRSPISFAEERYDQELGEILFPEGTDHVSHCSSEEAFSLILSGFLEDVRDLFQRVLTNDPKDPHFSAVTAEKKAALYLKCLNRSFSYPLDNFWKEQGYHQEEIRRFYENYRREYPIIPTTNASSIIVGVGSLAMRHTPAGEKFIMFTPLISLTFFKVLLSKNHET